MAIAEDWYIDYFNKLITHSTTEIPYDAKTAGFNEGQLLTGGTSTATARIVRDVQYLPYDALGTAFTVGATVTGAGAATGTIVSDSGTQLGLINVSGTFVDDETLTGSSGGDADANIPSGITTGYLNVVYVDGTFSNNETIADDGGTAGSATSDILSGVTTKTTTYTTRALYSHLQDTFDELVQLDDTVPMNAQTPTEFTLINDWFIDDDSIKFLTGGALKISSYSDANQTVRLISFGATYTNAVNSDIGLNVLGAAGDTGTLLHYNNTSKKWWVRVTNSGDTFAPAETTEVTTAGGTGTGTSLGTSTTGESLYANIYTLGTIAIDPNPETYIFQNSEAIAPWWGRGDSESHIDVLIKVKESNVEIDGAQITVFVRHYGDLYDHFPIDLTSGGRQAVPLASATDLNNNSTGEGYLFYTGSTTYTENLILTGGTSGATAEIFAVTDWTGTGVLTLGHIKGTFSNGETITDTSTGSAAVNGTVGYIYVTYDNEGASGFSVSDTVTGGTSTATAAVVAVQDDGSDGKLLLTPSGTTGYYLDFQDNEELRVSAVRQGDASADATRAVTAYDDISITFVNTQVDFASSTGTLTEGDVLTGASSGATCVFIEEIDGNTIALGNVDETAGTITAGEALEKDGSNYYTLHGTLNRSNTNTVERAFTQGSLEDYSILIDCAGRTMAEVYEWLKYVARESANSTDQINYVTMYPIHQSLIVAQDGEEYISGSWSPDTVFTPVKASPFGTFAGGKFFAARGVWVSNMDSADIQAFQLIDSTNNLTQTPPNFQSITISNLVSGDRVLVARTSSGSTINKEVFTLAAGNTSGNGTLVVNESIPSDTPDTGYVRVVDKSDTSINREQRYAYTAWSTSTFTLSGTLSRSYAADNSDTAYVPYIDTTASGTSASVTVIYSANRTVVARIRRYNSTVDSIQPFETTGTFNSTGYSTVTIRTPDTIVT